LGKGEKKGRPGPRHPPFDLTRAEKENIEKEPVSPKRKRKQQRRSINIERAEGGKKKRKRISVPMFNSRLHLVEIEGGGKNSDKEKRKKRLQRLKATSMLS